MAQGLLDGTDNCNVESCYPLLLESIPSLKNILAPSGVANSAVLLAKIFTKIMLFMTQITQLFEGSDHKGHKRSHVPVLQILYLIYLLPCWLLSPKSLILI